MKFRWTRIFLPETRLRGVPLPPPVRCLSEHPHKNNLRAHQFIAGGNLAQLALQRNSAIFIKISHRLEHLNARLEVRHLLQVRVAQTVFKLLDALEGVHGASSNACHARKRGATEEGSAGTAATSLACAWHASTAARS